MQEVLIPHVTPVRPATTIRSTVLQSSLASLRKRGHFDDWFARMQPEWRDQIVESVAPSWMPIEAGIAHYTACEALMLPMSEQVAMGEAVGDRIQGSFLPTLMKSVRSAGLNPLILLMHFDRLYARLFQGGSIQLVQTGPKDIDIEVRGLQLNRFPYFRLAFTGVVRAGIAFSGARSAHVKQQSYSADKQAFTMRAAWV